MHLNAYRFLMTRRRKSNQKQISKVAIKEELSKQYEAYDASYTDSWDNMWEARGDDSRYLSPPVTLSSSAYIDESYSFGTVANN